MLFWVPVEGAFHFFVHDFVPLVISELHSSGNHFCDREFRRWRRRWRYCLLAFRHHTTILHVRNEHLNLEPMLLSYILVVAGSNIYRDEMCF